jgi:hypothetical protein
MSRDIKFILRTPLFLFSTNFHSLTSFGLKYLPIFSVLVSFVLADLNAIENARKLVILNERFFVAVNRSIGAIDALLLDGQGLLGSPEEPLVTASMALGHTSTATGSPLVATLRDT